MSRFRVNNAELSDLAIECKAEEAIPTSLENRSDQELVDDHLRRRDAANRDKRRIRAQHHRSTRSMLFKRNPYS